MIHYSKWHYKLLPIIFLISLTGCIQNLYSENIDDHINDSQSGHFSILQVNDSYKIEGLENGSIGGFARLRTLRHQLESQGAPVLMLHGGDFLFPSVMSKYLKADSMIKILNLMDGNATGFDNNMLVVFGNHEFDSPDPGLLLRRIVQADFGWVSSNTRFHFSESSAPEPFSKRLSNVHDQIIKDINGIKVGLFGITLDNQKPPYIEYDYAPEARKILIKQMIADLKANGAQVIIALTHQDLDQDQGLAREFPEINLIIGGHEHFFIEQKIGKTWITKADADNKSAIVHEIQLLPDGSVETNHRKIVLNDQIEKDPQINTEVSKQLTRLAQEFQKNGKNMQEVLGYTEHLLEGVEPAIRGRETALGNFLADVIRTEMNSDIAFTNGGGVRINDNIPPGPITMYDMEGLFYYDNNLVSFELTGQQLLEILKNSISKAHLGDGRFLQVSGIRFTYHAKSSNSGYVYTINPAEVEIQQRGASTYTPLELDKTYRAASTYFIWEKGFSDGYAIFAKDAGKTSPSRIDNGKEISFRKSVENTLNTLPKKMVRQQIEGRIIRQE